MRDILLNRRPNDWDVCSDALPEQIMAIFPKAIPTGIKHGTVTVILGKSRVEVTTFRDDGRYINHRRPESVRFVTELTEDLRRRDFTINAMAMSSEFDILDPFGGRSDLSNKIIRCVGIPQERFNEDALRMFRALRFKAQLGFEIEYETLAALRENAFLATSLSPERIRDEIQKLLLSPEPSVLYQLVDCGLLDHLLLSRDLPDGLERISRLRREPTLRWAAFCAALAGSGAISSTEAFLRSLRLDNHTIQLCSLAAETAIPGFSGDDISLKRLLSRCGADAAECAAASYFALSGSDYRKSLRHILNSGQCWSIKQLDISGGDLIAIGLRGTEIGCMLQFLLEHVISNPQDNKNDILIQIAKSHCGQ